MLQIDHVSIQFQGNPRPSVQDFSLQMAPGEIVSIVGESGSGKTTLIRAVINALPTGGKLTGGAITFEGGDLAAYTADQWRQLQGTVISMIFQNAGAMINPIRTIGSQFVEYIRAHQPMGRAQARALATEMLGRMRLPHPANIMKSYSFQLSGGMRQRVGIAMAMTFHPRLLLADEPTSALDVTTQAQIIRQMMELRRDEGTGIIIVTHNLGVAAYMADQLIVMQNGRIVEQGKRDEILHHPQDPYTVKLLQAVPDIGGERFVS